VESWRSGALVRRILVEGSFNNNIYMSSLLFLGFLFLLFSHLNLRDRVSKLEEKRDATHPTPVAPAATYQAPAMPIPTPTRVEVESLMTVQPEPLPHFAPAQAAVAEPEKPSAFVTWFKEHTLIKIGGIFFFLGAAWFVSYAIKAGWLSPEIRILLGILLALAAYGLGHLRQSVAVVQYQVLTALGTGIMAATVLAAHSVFGLFDPILSLTLMAIATIYTVFVAYITRSLSLTVAAAVLGLIVPFFTGTAEDIYVLLPYLLILTSLLLLVGFVTEWRPLTFVLLVGVLGYECALVNTSSPLFLFVFMVIFSIVFFTSTTASMMKTGGPRSVDISSLALLSIGYIYLASALRPDATIAVFAATAVVGAVGYMLLIRHYSPRVVAVYLGLAGIGILIGTSFLFSGFTLVLAYICEVTAAFLLVTYLGLPERAVMAGAAAYLLPLFGSLESFSSPLWNNGAWHVDALVVYSMLAALLISTLWLVHKPGVAIHPSSRYLAALFGILTSVYAYAVAALVASAVFSTAFSPVITYLLWSLISISIFYYALKKNLPLTVAKMAAASLIIPVLASVPSFVANAWSTGVYHVHSFGLMGIIVMLLLATLLATQQFCRDYDRGLRTLIGTGIIVTTLYVCATLTTVWDSLLPNNVSLVASYVSYALVLYFLVSILVLARAQVAWIERAIMALALPALLSTTSFTATGWPEGPLAPEAVGLFALLTIAVLLGLGLDRRADYRDEMTKQKVFAPWSRTLYGIAILYTVGLVWSIAHSAVSQNEAVSLSLFIYTVTGLSAYLYGKRRENKDVKFVGVVLLTIVVSRLLLIDVWNMEILWRVVTLLGIGSLFIGASLLERQPRATEE
jgi:Predicted membrane protein (DUF2339)